MLRNCEALNYSAFEVITVVDKSPDQTEAIAEKWAKKPGFKVFVQDSNRGLSSARNLGARHAVGEIIAYLDAMLFRIVTGCDFLR